MTILQFRKCVRIRDQIHAAAVAAEGNGLSAHQILKHALRTAHDLAANTYAPPLGLADVIRGLEHAIANQRLSRETFDNLTIRAETLVEGRSLRMPDQTLFRLAPAQRIMPPCYHKPAENAIIWRRWTFRIAGLIYALLGAALLLLVVDGFLKAL